MENNFKFRSKVIQDLLSKPPAGLVRKGSQSILLTIALLGFLLYQIKYPDVIKCEALLTTKIQPEKIYSLFSGSIDSILVNDLQHVTKGSPLLVIENSASYTDISFLSNTINTIDKDSDLLNFPINEIRKLKLGTITSSYLQFEDKYLEYLYRKNFDLVELQEKSNKISVRELRKILKNVVAQSNVSENELVLLEKSLNRQKKLLLKGVISQQTFERNELEFLNKRKEHISILVRISEIKDQLGNSNRNSGNFILKENLEDEKRYNQVLQALNDLKASIEDWEIKYLIKANITGILTFASPLSSYQLLKPDDLIFTILPNYENNDYAIQLNAPIYNSGKLELGQDVHLKLFSYPDKEFGFINAKVSKISLLPDENKTYFVEANLSNGLATSFKKKIDYRGEMLGSAEIITKKLSLLERLINVINQSN